ncbi:MAG: heme biosynthesis HemY N-terminal domain-containing protein, partial [Thiotrichaceae bacterium]
MILIYILVILAVIAGSFWLFDTLLAEQSNIVLYWSGHSIELSAANLVAALIVTFLAFYIVLRIFKHLISMGKYAHNYRQRKTRRRTRNGLMQGLLSLVEGNWDKAETQLLADAAHSEIPVLHYLGAARAAHLREAYELRDQYLKQANEAPSSNGPNGRAEIAIAISQAEMQLYSEQLEQARAGLITLLEEHPKHHYAKKLLAKSYYKQEDWKNLSALLPEMNKLTVLNEKESERYETASLKGIFQMYASEDNVSKLKLEWKKIPTDIRNKSNAILLYSKALVAAGDNV